MAYTSSYNSHANYSRPVQQLTKPDPFLFPSHPSLMAAVGSQSYHTSSLSSSQPLPEEPPKLPSCTSHSIPQEKKAMTALAGSSSRTGRELGFTW